MLGHEGAAASASRPARPPRAPARPTARAASTVTIRAALTKIPAAKLRLRYPYPRWRQSSSLISRYGCPGRRRDGLAAVDRNAAVVGDRHRVVLKRLRRRSVRHRSSAAEGGAVAGTAQARLDGRARVREQTTLVRTDRRHPVHAGVVAGDCDVREDAQRADRERGKISGGDRPGRWRPGGISAPGLGLSENDDARRRRGDPEKVSTIESTGRATRDAQLRHGRLASHAEKFDPDRSRQVA